MLQKSLGEPCFSSKLFLPGLLWFTLYPTPSAPSPTLCPSSSASPIHVLSQGPKLLITVTPHLTLLNTSVCVILPRSEKNETPSSHLPIL